MNRHPGRHGKFPRGRNPSLAPVTRQNAGNAIRLAMGLETPPSASKKNMQREERLGLQPDEFKLVFHVYSSH